MKYLKALLKFYTQSELAKELGYSSRSTISNWLKVQKIPNNKMGQLQKMYEGLNLK